MSDKKGSLSIILVPINIVLALFLVFFFLVTLAKIYLTEGFPEKSAKLFKIARNKTGLSFSLLENDKIEDFKKIWSGSTPPEIIQGLESWSANDYEKASKHFSTAGHSDFYFDTIFAAGHFDILNKLEKLTPLQKARLDNEKKINTENIRIFFDSSCWHAVSRTFLRMNNIQTSAYYLLKKPTKKVRLLADLLIGKETDILTEIDNNSDILNLVRGNYTNLKGSYPFVSDNISDAILKYNNIEQIINSFTGIKNNDLSDSLYNDFKTKLPNLQIFHILPKKLETHDASPLLTTLIATSLSLIILLLIISIFILYKKYKANLIIQRQKELEKMDALSIAKNQSMEARRKRDKTELNVSSFVTMNIQLEVLDLAFTKLGVRANPEKLAEQIEKTKIPNISFKIYTISNSYGLKVKMLNMTIEDIMKNDSTGIMILVLKGDLVALLKRADNQNAYLQFSKKDSRKVPFPALKLSWEGNVILLNI